MSQHSAEFLRGAVAALERKPYDRPSVAYLLAQYRQLLAQAESREAAPDAAAVIAQCREALEIARQQFGSHAGEGQNEELCEQALAAVAAWEAGRG